MISVSGKIARVHWIYLLECDADQVAAGGDYDTESVLACLFIADISHEPFLSQWLELHTTNAIGQLAHFIRFNWETIMTGGVWNAFLDDEHSSFPEAAARKTRASDNMRQWLQQHDVWQQLQWLKTELKQLGSSSHTLESAEIALQLLQNAAQEVSS